MLNKLSNMIKRALVSLTNKDNGQFSTAQVKWNNGKVAVVETVSPYGLSSNAPKDSLALMFNVMGQEENRAAIPYNSKERFKNLKEGEVALGNFITKSNVKFLENGDIDITGVSDLNVNISGKVNITSAGNINITAPITTINGALQVTGDITAFHGLTNSLSSSDVRSTYNSHTHDENDNAPAPTNAPNEVM